MSVRQIADRLAEINTERNEEDRALLFVDGVHGFGVEATPISELGCDFRLSRTLPLRSPNLAMNNPG